MDVSRIFRGCSVDVRGTSMDFLTRNIRGRFVHGCSAEAAKVFRGLLCAEHPRKVREWMFRGSSESLPRSSVHGTSAEDPRPDDPRKQRKSSVVIRVRNSRGRSVNGCSAEAPKVFRGLPCMEHPRKIQVRMIRGSSKSIPRYSVRGTSAEDP